MLIVVVFKADVQKIKMIEMNTVFPQFSRGDSQSIFQTTLLPTLGFTVQTYPVLLSNIFYLGAEMIKIKKSSEPACRGAMIHQCKGDLALLQPVTSASLKLQCLLK